MITKKGLAKKAEHAMRAVADDAVGEGQTPEDTSGLYFMCGVFWTLGRYSGYLSTGDIQKNIDEARKEIPGFAAAYDKEMNA